MVMPDNQPEKTTTHSEHSEHTEVVERSGPPVQIINQSERWWLAQVIDALAAASRSASINNLLLLIVLMGAVVVGWKLLPPVIEVLNTMNKHIPEQTVLLQQISKENERRNDMQHQGIEIQASQTKQLSSIQELQDRALTNHAKIIENQAAIAEGSRSVLEVLAKINTLLDKQNGAGKP